MGGTNKKIRETLIYLPDGTPPQPCTLVYAQADSRCKARGIHKDQAYVPLSALDIDNAGIDELHGAYQVGTDHASTHLLYFIIEGAVWGISQQFQQLLQPGDLFVAPAGSAAWIQLTEGSAKAVWFHFHDTQRWAFLKKEGAAVHSAHNTQGIGTVMDLLIRDQASRRPAREAVARHYGEILAIYIQQALHDWGSPSERLSRQQLQRLHDQLFERLDEAWSVEQMAKLCNMSKGHLTLLTKRTYQQTPMELLCHIRMERACTLLLNTSQTVDRIAQQVGYRTAYAFSDAFQRHTGKRPGVYRRLK